eukprot:CAMPEP_0206155386 /NCGR_PEP_ID=MMETSP1474-20131121/2081_1 /ASSEMBLY_ACC=CAM_ASM_001110 /TAXON_ID=97495 /ORGANISM="Imantonia sp., Strain RCC918" /LENGTH=181 /DNA_ID=CAMNT_0053554011 /DNA_START=15 /DNA_END=561 /DNA_ORIENTATION=-
MKATLALLLCLQAATGLVVTPQVPSLSGALARRPLNARMQVEDPDAAAPASPVEEVNFAPPAATPPAEEKGFQFDPANYSMTISIGVVFIAIKALSAAGIIDFSDEPPASTTELRRCRIAAAPVVVHRSSHGRGDPSPPLHPREIGQSPVDELERERWHTRDERRRESRARAPLAVARVVE